MTDTVTSADGTPIAYSKVGSGPAVILVDGAMSYRAWSTTLQAVAEALSADHTVYSYDRRGRGESGKATEYSAAAEVADLAALIEHAGGSAALVGFSSGAVTALEAARAGLPVTSLSLYEPPFVVDDTRIPVTAEYREQVMAAVAAGRPGDAVELFLTVACAMPAEFVEPMKQDPTWSGMEALAPTLASDASVMADTMSGDPATLDKYQAVSTPTLVVHGGGGVPHFASAAETITKVLPDARHEVLPGQDHDVSPDVLCPILAAWLREQH